MKTLATLTDPVFKGEKQYSGLDKFFLKLIHDERDLPFIYLSLRITFIMLPLGLAMYIPGLPWWAFTALAIAYFYVNNLVFKGPFGLMLHCTSHRKWFKKEYNIFNYYLAWIVGPFFGQTPETYFSHHIGMHHPENNLPDDDSSTMFYQRDSFREWVRYWATFMTVGIFRVTGYFKDRDRMSLFWKMWRGEFLFFALVGVLLWVNWLATLMVFILPFLISRIIMMMGNWTQHAFIDPDEPGNAYKNSISCINHKYNHKCWNDGYHISHHIKPSMHWTEHPHHLTRYRSEYAANKAFVFDGIDFLKVFVLLMKKKYDVLADHIVNIDGMWDSKEQVIAEMKRRTEYISKEKFKALGWKIRGV